MSVSVALLGQRLQEARIRAGLTQEQLAERIELTASHISKIERGAKNLTIVRLSHICDALNVELESILGLANTPQNSEYNKQFGAIASGCKPETVSAMLDVCTRIANVEASCREVK